MPTLKLTDGAELYYKDWGTGQPLVFHHGWPLSGDDWEGIMIYFLHQGYRVIAHDRRGHGRSTQTSTGHEMDTYAADVAELTKHLDLKNAVHIGHSTGGGEVIHYVAKYGQPQGRVAKAVLISAVPPIMVQQADNPNGVPKSIFDGIRLQTATRRAEFFAEFPVPFYGYNREGVKPSQAIIDNWWRQGMMGGINAHYECIKAFSETDFREDLKTVTLPVLVLHGDDDQIVPIDISAKESIKLLKNGKIIIYPGLPHGMPVTHGEIICKDLLEFIKS